MLGLSEIYSLGCHVCIEQQHQQQQQKAEKGSVNGSSTADSSMSTALQPHTLGSSRLAQSAALPADRLKHQPLAIVVTCMLLAVGDLLLMSDHQ